MKHKCPQIGFNFAMNTEYQKSMYQAMLVIAKKTKYVVCDPSTRIHYFFHSIIDPSIAQIKFALEVSFNNNTSNIVIVEYVMGCMSYQHVNQCLSDAIFSKRIHDEGVRNYAYLKSFVCQSHGTSSPRPNQPVQIMFHFQCRCCAKCPCTHFKGNSKEHKALVVYIEREYQY